MVMCIMFLTTKDTTPVLAVSARECTKENLWKASAVIGLPTLVTVVLFVFKLFYPRITSSNASSFGGTINGFCISFVRMSGSFNP